MTARAALRASARPAPPVAAPRIGQRAASAHPMRKAGCTCGGACPACKAAAERDRRGALPVSQPGDVYEREADALAERVLSGGAAILRPPHQLATRYRRGCVGSFCGRPWPRVPTPQRAGSARLAWGIPRQETRAFFEPRFGRDFSQVRVHTTRARCCRPSGHGSVLFRLGKQPGVRRRRIRSTVAARTQAAGPRTGPYLAAGRP